MRGAAWSLVLVLIAMTASVNAAPRFSFGFGRGRGGASVSSSTYSGSHSSSSSTVSVSAGASGQILTAGNRNLVGAGFAFGHNRQVTSIASTMELVASIKTFNRVCGDSGDDPCDVRPVNRVSAGGERGKYTNRQTCIDDMHCWSGYGPEETRCFRRKTDTCARPKRLRIYEKSWNTRDTCEGNGGCYDPLAPIGERCYLSNEDLCTVEQPFKRFLTDKYGGDLDYEHCAWANGCWDENGNGGEKCYLKASSCVSAPRGCFNMQTTNTCDHKAGVGTMKIIWTCANITNPRCNRRELFEIHGTRPCCLKAYEGASIPTNGGSPADGSSPASGSSTTSNTNNDDTDGTAPGADAGAGVGPPGEGSDDTDDGNDSPDSPTSPPSEPAQGSSPSTGGTSSSADTASSSVESQITCEDVWPICEGNGVLERDMEGGRPDCQAARIDRLRLLHGDNPDPEWEISFDRLAVEVEGRGCMRNRGGCHGEGGRGRCGYVFGRVVPIVIRHFKEGGGLCNILDVLEDMKGCILNRFSVDRDRLQTIVKTIGEHIHTRFAGRMNDVEPEEACDMVITCISSRFQDPTWGDMDSLFGDLVEHVTGKDEGFYGVVDHDHSGFAGVLRHVVTEVFSHFRERQSGCGVYEVLDDMKGCILRRYEIEEYKVDRVFKLVVEHMSVHFSITKQGTIEMWMKEITTTVELRHIEGWGKECDRDFEEVHLRVESSSTIESIGNAIGWTNGGRGGRGGSSRGGSNRGGSSRLGGFGARLRNMFSQ